MIVMLLSLTFAAGAVLVYDGLSRCDSPSQTPFLGQARRAWMPFCARPVLMASAHETS